MIDRTHGRNRHTEVSSCIVFFFVDGYALEATHQVGLLNTTCVPLFNEYTAPQSIVQVTNVVGVVLMLFSIRSPGAHCSVVPARGMSGV
jgi:hypothetical protein